MVAMRPLQYNPRMLKVGSARRALATPVEAPRSLDAWWPAVARLPFPFLLDSCGAGRYSFLGSNPYAVLVAKADRVSVWREGRERTHRGDPFDALAGLLAERPADPDLPLPFPGGAVGAFGYDLGAHLERLPRRAADDLGAPDLALGFYDRVLTVDHQDRRAWIVELSDRSAPRAMDRRTYDEAFGATSALSAGANFTRPRYLEAVGRARDYIAAGDVYQVNLSQRFHARVEREPWDVFRALRAASPAPFAALLGLGRRSLMSVSPERFLELRGRSLLTRPIKGTRRRSPDDDDDERLRQELWASAKDDAELAMIVDLERNDLGRVCETGSVRVTSPKVLESHPTVHHLSATVEGSLRRGLGPVDVLRATFPGGSVTGAPKVRAMEIIDELEPTRRGFYTGALGMIGLDGSMNLSVAIRTVWADGPDHYFQAGGGITWDSDPDAEYDETLAKAAALARVLGVPLS
jgi:para-aminobenzoate synthetase component 1